MRFLQWYGKDQRDTHRAALFRLSMGLRWFLGIREVQVNTRYTESMSPAEFLPE